MRSKEIKIALIIRPDEISLADSLFTVIKTVKCKCGAPAYIIKELPGDVFHSSEFIHYSEFKPITNHKIIYYAEISSS